MAIELPSCSRSLPLRVLGLRKTFVQGDDRVEALRGVEFEAAPGTFVAIMGPSGSGKSTLLHLIAGLTRPDAGTVEIEGVDIAAMPDREQTLFRRRRIGVIFQAYNLIPSLTAEQNILLPLALEGDPADAGADLWQLLERLDLVGRRHHRPDALSGGEQQRVAIARALIGDPALLLADEPTGNLDTDSTRRLCRQLKEICRERGKLLLLVTHEPSVAFHADFVCVMKDGRLGNRTPVSAFGGVDELALHYQAVVAGRAGEEGSA